VQVSAILIRDTNNLPTPQFGQVLFQARLTGPDEDGSLIVDQPPQI